MGCNACGAWLKVEKREIVVFNKVFFTVKCIYPVTFCVYAFNVEQRVLNYCEVRGLKEMYFLRYF